MTPTTELAPAAADLAPQRGSGGSSVRSVVTTTVRARRRGVHAVAPVGAGTTVDAHARPERGQRGAVHDPTAELAPELPTSHRSAGPATPA
jgi:hypothetical protein